ncbi:hypothetical protein OSSY52_02120 [Tepiditoga spiralis]|uniref:Hydantoinase A/oxoprolinase domain-containing protein n=1 Tax=Tepiditoga spiralis TaxID=2108365 RepID=A0A7G1G1D2_9BACT|nr:hypothetical protein [Tepiditoga spiralis]BBE30071.1 hypothetical protein OSSY52_02120 [Tepiditoga spiralis]
MEILTLDIGGANLKYCIFSFQSNKIEIKEYDELNILNNNLNVFELFLKKEIFKITSKNSIDKILFTQTASLIYENNKEGVKKIASILKEVFKGEIFMFTPDRLINIEILDFERYTECYNWAITRELCKDRKGIIIDMGSTSTDIIPILEKENNKNNIMRLIDGEVNYLGMVRTILQSVIKTVPYKNFDVPIIAEPILKTGDIFYYLDMIPYNKHLNYSSNIKFINKLEIENKICQLIASDKNFLSKEEINIIIKYIYEEIKNTIKFKINKIMKKNNLDNNITLFATGYGINNILKEIYKEMNFSEYITLENLLNVKKYTPAIGLGYVYFKKIMRRDFSMI